MIVKMQGEIVLYFAVYYTFIGFLNIIESHLLYKIHFIIIFE
jgi:hypothetical protein